MSAIKIEQLVRLPKAMLYKTSYDGLLAELPKTANLCLLDVVSGSIGLLSGRMVA